MHLSSTGSPSSPRIYLTSAYGDEENVFDLPILTIKNEEDLLSQTSPFISRKQKRSQEMAEQTLSPVEKKSKSAQEDFRLISYAEFQGFLREAKNSQDPFMALANLFSQKDGHWTCFIRFDDESCAECQLAIDEWDSTCFSEKRPGLFRFIELFEYDVATGITDEQQLFTIRLSEGCEEGEWLSINKGKRMSGRQAKALAEEISRAMKIKTCYLADMAKIVGENGNGGIAIRVPLQIISGKGYYSPPFSMVHTEHPVPSEVVIEGTNETLYFDQNVKKYQKKLAWLQGIKIKKIYHSILENRPEDQRSFLTIVERYLGGSEAGKGDSKRLLKKCRWTFQQFLSLLYQEQKNSPTALADYQWVYNRLLHTEHLSTESKRQKRYFWIIERLFFNMLMSANFSQ